jgi:hypothetical protein
VAAIKEAGGNVKRFVPSEYGVDVDQLDRDAMMEPARSILQAKVRLREAVRAPGIPHTFICSYWTHWFVLPRLGDPQVNGPPGPDTTTATTIFGDEKTQVIRVAGWKGKLVLYGARLTLLGACLASIPIYLLSVIKFPKWAIKVINT